MGSACVCAPIGCGLGCAETGGVAAGATPAARVSPESVPAEAGAPLTAAGVAEAAVAGADRAGAAVAGGGTGGGTVGLYGVTWATATVPISPMKAKLMTACRILGERPRIKIIVLSSCDRIDETRLNARSRLRLTLLCPLPMVNNQGGTCDNRGSTNPRVYY